MGYNARITLPLTALFYTYMLGSGRVPINIFVRSQVRAELTLPFVDRAKHNFIFLFHFTFTYLSIVTAFILLNSMRSYYIRTLFVNYRLTNRHVCLMLFQRQNNCKQLSIQLVLKGRSHLVRLYKVVLLRCGSKKDLMLMS